MQTIQICPNPIFIVGCPRSGTSMFSHTLGEHSKLWCSEESDFIFQLLLCANDLYSSCTKRGERQWLPSFNISRETFLQHIGYGVNSLFSKYFDCMRWIDKTIGNTLEIDLLIKAFPGAKFINVVRDGRDVVHSMINSGFSEPWSSDFEEACKTWVTYANIALLNEEKHPNKIINIRVEDLHDTFEKEMTRVLNFLDLEYEESMLEHYTNEHKNANSSFSKDSERTTWEVWTPEQRFVFARWCLSTLRQLNYSSGII